VCVCVCCACVCVCLCVFVFSLAMFPHSWHGHSFCDHPVLQCHVRSVGVPDDMRPHASVLVFVCVCVCVCVCVRACVCVAGILMGYLRHGFCDFDSRLRRFLSSRLSSVVTVALAVAAARAVFGVVVASSALASLSPFSFRSYIHTHTLDFVDFVDKLKAADSTSSHFMFKFP